jgi:hypothetical protein
MTPFLGQGGCSGLRDAINLAWKLDLVLKGVARERLLDTYALERRPHARTYVDLSDRLAAMIFTEEPAAAAERDQLYLSGASPPPAPDPIVSAGLLQPNLRPPVGAVGPQGRVRLGGREGRFDDLLGWGFQLITSAGDTARLLTAAEVAFLESIGGVTAAVGPEPGQGTVVDLDGAYLRFLAEHRISAVLMRPDFVVFGVAGAPDQGSGLVEQLREQISYNHALPTKQKPTERSLDTRPS